MATACFRWVLSLPLLVALPQSAASGPAPAAADACTLTMGWDPREPYQLESANGDVRGIDVEIVKAIVEDAGCTLLLEAGQRHALLDGLKHGRVDVLAGAIATTPGEAIAHFSVPYRESSTRLYIRKGEGEYLAASSHFFEVLENGPRVGLVQGYDYGKDISEQQIGGEFEDFFVGAVDARANLAALVEMDVDVVAEDPLVAAALLSRHGWQDRIELHPLDLGTNQVCLMFSRVSVDEALVKRLSQSIETLKSSGEIDAIIHQERGSGSLAASRK